MPTTANFSLEYPDDNSSVDIAGHFETLADDVDAAINTRLALTGGTLTGALVGTLTTDSSSSTTGAFKTAGGMGIAKALYVGTTLNVTGATTLTGDLTISKAQPYIFLDKTNANWQGIAFRTGTSNRWALQVNNTSESSTATGSDLVLTAYNNSGSTLSTPLSITRSTGAVTLTGDLTISKASPFLTVYATSGNSYVLVNRPAGSVGGVALQTNNATRWLTSVTNTAESGSNAGSDFAIATYNDAGALLSTPLTITRSTGATTLTGDLTISKASPVHTVNATSGSGAINISSASGQYAALRLHTSGTNRWTFNKNNVAESGGDVGSDFQLYRYTDAGAGSVALEITRSTGLTTLTSLTVSGTTTLSGDLTLTKATPSVIVNASSAAQESMVTYQTGGVDRWKIGKNLAAESGSDGGSNFTVRAYSDAGALLSTPITILRGSGAMTLTGNVTLDRSGGAFNMTAATGNTLNFRFQTSGTNRWSFIKTSEAESGSDAGSNFQLYKYTDGGSGTVNLDINRSTGKWTFRDVGSSAGLELGTSGPRVMSGTGSPEGVVTAPVGSTWIDTAATTGAIRWIKASGTGNTGWVVEYGDTGTRNIAASISNGWTVSPHMHLRRTGNMVTLYVRQLDGAAASATTFVTLPTGFRPAYDFLHFPVALSGSTFTGYGGAYSTGEVEVYGTSSACTGGRALLTFPTSNAWPTSLPGSAA